MAKRPRRKTFIQQSRAISSLRKAQIHEEEGAGKSHVRRPFFGLNDQDEDALVKRLSDSIDDQLKG